MTRLNDSFYLEDGKINDSLLLEDGKINDSFLLEDGKCVVPSFWNSFFKMVNEMFAIVVAQLVMFIIDSKCMNSWDCLELSTNGIEGDNCLIDTLNRFSICISMYYHRSVYALLNSRVH